MLVGVSCPAFFSALSVPPSVSLFTVNTSGIPSLLFFVDIVSVIPSPLFIAAVAVAIVLVMVLGTESVRGVRCFNWSCFIEPGVLAEIDVLSVYAP